MAIAIALLAVGFGFIGTACVAALPPERPLRPGESLAAGFYTVLAGLATLSWVTMILALARVLSVGTVALAALVIAGATVWRRHAVGVASIARIGPTRLRAVAAACLVVLVTALAMSAIAPPFDARLASSDASVYLAAANRVSHAGAIGGYEALASEMSTQERAALFANRFPGDSTGPFARFPGGVRLIAPDSGWVTFHFYHLWPVWLGFLHSLFGSPGFLAALPVFGSVALISLYLVGALLAGRIFGLLCAALLFVMYPEIYYLRLPVSEISAQAYFLGGLLCFVRASQAELAERNRLQLLAAALWGCFSLARADGVLLLIPALFASFVCNPTLRRARGDWLPLGTGIVLAAALALLHQVAGGTYEDALRHIPLARALFLRMSAVLAPYEPLVLAVWLAITSFALFVASSERYPRVRRALRVLVETLMLLVSVGSVVMFAGRVDAAQIVRHLRWLELYIPIAVLAAAFVGLAILVTLLFRDAARSRLPALALPFLVVPLVALLINPMVTPTQPWAIRRFVPMALPMLGLLSLLGWYLALRALPFKKSTAAIASGALAALAMGTLLGKSSFLLSQPLFSQVEAQIARVAKHIPADALVLIPDEQAGMHLQVALQYEHEKAALLLPFSFAQADGTDAAKRYATVQAYVRRQVASGRPVIALLDDQRFAGWLAARFALEYAFAEPMTFSMPVEAPDDVFPKATARVGMNYAALRLREHRDAAVPTVVDVGRPDHDLRFLIEGFAAPEGDRSKPGGTFRWTLANAQLALPRTRIVRIHYHSWRPAQAPSADLRVAIDGVPVAFDDRTAQNGDHVLEIPVAGHVAHMNERFVLSLTSTPFSMHRLGLSADARELGIPIFRIEVEPH
jgi:hypothetical protein